MELASEVLAWFGDPEQWSGTGGIPNRVLEHLVLSVSVVVVGSILAIAIGLVIGHTGRGAFLAIAIANVGRALPSYSLLLIFFTFFGIGFATAFPALLVLTIPPVLTSTYVAIREVDRDTVEAGRALGLSEAGVLRDVEVPIALPIIIGGVGVAAVQVVATATLAALVGGGGLGRYIVDGFALQQEDQLVGGALLVAGLAILTERLFTLVERRLVSPGLRGRTTEVLADAAAAMTGSPTR